MFCLFGAGFSIGAKQQATDTVSSNWTRLRESTYFFMSRVGQQTVAQVIDCVAKHKKGVPTHLATSMAVSFIHSEQGTHLAPSSFTRSCFLSNGSLDGSGLLHLQKWQQKRIRNVRPRMKREEQNVFKGIPVVAKITALQRILPSSSSSNTLPVVSSRILPPGAVVHFPGPRSLQVTGIIPINTPKVAKKKLTHLRRLKSFLQSENGKEIEWPARVLTLNLGGIYGCTRSKLQPFSCEISGNTLWQSGCVA